VLGIVLIVVRIGREREREEEDKILKYAAFKDKEDYLRAAFKSRNPFIF
jgi:hypothetical protein